MFLKNFLYMVIADCNHALSSLAFNANDELFIHHEVHGKSREIQCV